MSKLSIKFKNLWTKFAGLKKQANVVFWMILLIIFVLEFFVVMRSVSIILETRRQPVVVKKTPGVRINFENYNYAVERIEKAKTFQTSPRVSRNPFGMK